MTFKEFIRFMCGLCLGISVQYLKPTKRFLWPTGCVDIDEELKIFLGGSSVCGILKSGRSAVLINTNQSEAAEKLKAYVDSLGVGKINFVINTSVYRDFSGGNQLFSDAGKVLIPDVSNQLLNREMDGVSAAFEKVSAETQISFGDETVVIVPVRSGYSAADLVVYLEKRSVLFLGGLFYKHIHPILRAGEGIDVDGWIRQLEALISRFQPNVCVPAEGELGSVSDVEEFIRYLRDLSDREVEFQHCRSHYDWKEIPGYTSLEENFDLIRRGFKSHTVLTPR